MFKIEIREAICFYAEVSMKLIETCREIGNTLKHERKAGRKKNGKTVP